MSHIYNISGSFPISIRGKFNSFKITKGQDMLTEITQFGDCDITFLTDAFNGCTKLTSVKTGNDDNLTKLEDVNRAWQGCSGLTIFNIDLPNVYNADSAWRDCISLETFTSKITHVNTVISAWENCTSLNSFECKLLYVHNASCAWKGCIALTRFNHVLQDATNVSSAWSGCYGLKQFRNSLQHVNNANSAWKDCSSLYSFNTDLYKVTDISGSWDGSGITRQSQTFFGEIGFNQLIYDFYVSLTPSTNPLILVVDTSIVDASNIEFEISVKDPSGVTINWGDSSSEKIYKGPSHQLISHKYDQSGRYIIKITGYIISFRIMHGNKMLTEIVQFGDCGIRTLHDAFNDCTYLKSVNSPKTDEPLQLGGCTRAWKGCTNLDTFNADLYVLTDASGAWDDTNLTHQFQVNLINYDIYTSNNPAKIWYETLNPNPEFLQTEPVADALYSVDAVVNETNINTGLKLTLNKTDISFNFHTQIYRIAKIKHEEELIIINARVSQLINDTADENHNINLLFDKFFISYGTKYAIFNSNIDVIETNITLTDNTLSINLNNIIHIKSNIEIKLNYIKIKLS